VTLLIYTKRNISVELHSKNMRFWHSYMFIGRLHTTPNILFVNFLITRRESLYVHVNVSQQFGSFMIHDFITYMRDMQLKILSSEKYLGFLIH